MNNEEKIKAWCEYDSNNMDMYELIVAGEREKMQGVDCFVSWDGRDNGTVDVWHKDEPSKGANDMFYGSSDANGKHSHISELHKDFAKLLGISPGQCKKFRIVEVLP